MIMRLLVLLLMIVSLSWGCVAFVEWELSPANWEPFGRAAYLFLFGAMLFVVMGVINDAARPKS